MIEPADRDDVHKAIANVEEKIVRNGTNEIQPENRNYRCDGLKVIASQQIRVSLMLDKKCTTYLHNYCNKTRYYY